MLVVNYTNVGLKRLRIAERGRGGYYGNEYGYLSNLFDNGVYFGINNMLKFENINKNEIHLCIFNRYLLFRRCF